MPVTKPAKTEQGSRSWLDAWHVNPSVNRDYDFIDGLRGIAIYSLPLLKFSRVKRPPPQNTGSPGR
jgi:hypothetical protein